MGYRILDGLEIPQLDGYDVRSVEHTDIEAIRQWRNAQLSVLRQSQSISRRQQMDYYTREVWGDERSPKPRQMLFVLTRDTERCAYGGLTNIDWDARRAEMSFLASLRIAIDPTAYSRRLHAFLEIVVRGIAFDLLGFHRVWHEAYDVRQLASHHAVLESFGFRQEGRLRDHVMFGRDYVDSLVYGMIQ